MSSHPIAVFDSGLGGLSVVRHLRQLLPHENLVYFGDTARIPYGTKSRPTVVQFALETAGFLLQFEPKLIVAACNTASALALDVLQRELPVPVIGVVEPGAGPPSGWPQGRPAAVIGTEATIASSAYRKAIRALAPEQPVIALACPLFVPLVEEGRDCDDPIVRLAVETYLGAAAVRGPRRTRARLHPLSAAARRHSRLPGAGRADRGQRAGNVPDRAAAPHRARRLV